jgi:hypothetical protein
MYNTKIECTYYKEDIFFSTDNISEDEKEFIRDTIYRQEFLNIFELEDFDENKLAESMHELFEKIKECKQLNECLEKAAAQFMATDKEFGLQILFSFDFMYLTHICISEYLDKGFVSSSNLENIFKRLE